MYSFLISLCVLILGYIVYGRYIQKLIRPDSKRVTVAIEKNDGVDFIPMPTWKLFLIQFLNIAGLGPIFGAIMGAKFGVAAYMWIVLGTIFAGGVHDYVSGMISLRNGGESLPESIGRYLGTNIRKLMLFVSIVLLIFVGVVFVSGPAAILSDMCVESAPWANASFWIGIVFLYYFVVTLLPVDKVIGKVYPIFAVVLLFMVLVIFAMLFVYGWDLPEFTDPIAPHPNGLPIFPIMFVSIACGAISGFHSTQSPMMARCMKNEKLGFPIFYGAMVLEGIVTLVWAAAAIHFFGENGMGEIDAAVVAKKITSSWLGTFGAVLAMLGIVCAPISTGDTALRSARLIIGDMLKIDQKSVRNRLLVSIALFSVTLTVLLISVGDPAGFNAVWRYCSWCNQLIALFTLWMITVYFVREKKNYWVSLVPTLFMTSVTASYLFVAPEGLQLPIIYGYIIGGGASLVSLLLFIAWKRKQ